MGFPRFFHGENVGFLDLEVGIMWIFGWGVGAIRHKD